MRILSKIKKNYGYITNLLKNTINYSFNNIRSITYDGSNLYILGDELYVYNYANNIINVLSGNVTITNGKRIEYNNGNIYILDNNNLYTYNLSSDIYQILISGSPNPINNFLVKTSYIIYDDTLNVYKYNKTSTAKSKLTKVNGNVIDMVADNQTLFTCYNTYVQKTNYVNSTGSTSNIIVGLPNIKSIAYDGLLLYLETKSNIHVNLNELYKVYTKDGLEYTEPKITGITGYQDILYDGNYIYYTENNLIYRFNEEGLFYDYNITNVSKMRYNNYDSNIVSELVCLVDGNLIISNGNHFDIFELNFSNIIDYSYNDKSKMVINESNIFIVSNLINEFPQNYYLDATSITSYYVDGANIVYTLDSGLITHTYYIPSSNKYINTQVYRNDIIPSAITYDLNSKTYYSIDTDKLIKYRNASSLNPVDSLVVVIKDGSLLNNDLYSKIEYNSGKIYIKNDKTNIIYSISANSSVSNILTLPIEVYKTHQSVTDSSNIYIMDRIKNITKINLNNNNIILNKELKLSASSITEYNGYLLISTNNYIRKFDNNLNELDTFSSPFLMGNIYDSYISINTYNGNIFIADSINYEIIKLHTNSTNNYSKKDYYQISLDSNTPLTPCDTTIYNNNLYVGCLQNGYILRYNITNTGITLLSNISLKQKLEVELIINNIKYSTELNGLLVTTDTGLYLVHPNLSDIKTVYDNNTELNGLAFYRNFIYTFDASVLYKYSTLHYLSPSTYTFSRNNTLNNNILITNYTKPTKIINNNTSVYILDNNNILYYNIDDISKMYSLYDYNITQNANIIDIKVDTSNLYVLKDNHIIDSVNEYGIINKTYSNIHGVALTLPTSTNSIYYISTDNKIKVVNSSNIISTVLEPRGIHVDEQSLYMYNNKVINIYNKNNAGITQLDDSIYYSNNNHMYNLNKSGITEDLGIISQSINGISNDTSNIIICTMNSVNSIDFYENPSVSSIIATNLNNPFKAIYVSGYYYISDTFNHQIISINSSMQSNIIATGLNFPRGIEYKSGYLYIVDSGSDKIVKINANTNVQLDFSQSLAGIIDLTFTDSILYVTSLLQNSVLRIDTMNNNALTQYINVEKPYYIDNVIHFLISKDTSVSISVLSYADLQALINASINNINILITNNQLYNINNTFKTWIDTQINNAQIEKNMNKKYDKYVQIEQLLNTMNSSMDYTDAAVANLVTDFDIFKHRMYMVLQSFVKMFRLFANSGKKK